MMWLIKEFPSWWTVHASCPLEKAPFLRQRNKGCGHGRTGSKQKGKEIFSDSHVWCKYMQSRMHQDRDKQGKRGRFPRRDKRVNKRQVNKYSLSQILMRDLSICHLFLCASVSYLQNGNILVGLLWGINDLLFLKHLEYNHLVIIRGQKSLLGDRQHLVLFVVVQ